MAVEIARGTTAELTEERMAEAMTEARQGPYTIACGDLRTELIAKRIFGRSALGEGGALALMASVKHDERIGQDAWALLNSQPTPDPATAT